MDQPFDLEADIPAVAVIGMAIRVPGASSLDTFWHNLAQGKEMLSTFSDEQLRASGVSEELLRDPHYVKVGAKLEDIDQFDAAFFGFSARDAEILDPQRRLLLECAYEALEHAGYPPGCGAQRVGVFAGVGGSHYFFRNLVLNGDLANRIGFDALMRANDRDFAATELSYKLNLTGPSLTVSSACSTSLMSVHLACKSLLNYECDLAIGGGAAIHTVTSEGYLYQEGNIFSPDGHCRAFDAQAKGTVAGSGAGIVALKRLEDAVADGDTVLAIIRGSSANNDGSDKVGYTAPSVAGQSNAIAEALAAGEVSAASISYVEAHGTGTALGDPIELRALNNVLRSESDKLHFCAIGSLKTNLGHAGTASGILGLIKAVLVCRHKQIPPSLHYDSPNPMFDFASSALYVNRALAPWNPDGGVRRAGVSSFGIGGTNVHMVLEEYSAPALADVAAARVWPLSGKSEAAVRAAAERLHAHLEANPETPLERAAYTLQQGREAHSHRLAVVAAGRDELLLALKNSRTQEVAGEGAAVGEHRAVAFLFPGQGAQHIDMARELYAHEPVFRQHLDHCCDVLQASAGLDLRAVLLADADNAGVLLAQTRYTQPALFAVEYALARQWMAWGITPSIMLGHSLGEYVCACIAGVMSCDDALRLVATRAQLMQSLPPGAMLAVPLSLAELSPLLGSDLWLAAHNAGAQLVVSGPLEAIERLEKALAERAVDSRRLSSAHAFHSGMVEPILAQFEAAVRAVPLSAPSIAYMSNVTGRPILAAQATDPAYWAQHMRAPVQFFGALEYLLEAPDNALLLEVGPGQTLSSLARRLQPKRVIASLPKPADPVASHRHLLSAAARLWERNAAIDWAALRSGPAPGRTPLPTYPWQRERHWIEPSPAVMAIMHALANPDQAPLVLSARSPGAPTATAHAAANEVAAPSHSALEESILAIMRDLFGQSRIGLHDNFFDLGGDSLLATRCVSRLNRELRISLTVKAFMEHPNAAAVAALVEALAAHGVQDAPVDAAQERELGVL